MVSTVNASNTVAPVSSQINNGFEDFGAQVPYSSHHINTNIALEANSDGVKDALFDMIADALHALTRNLGPSHSTRFTNTNMTPEARHRAENNLLHRVANYLRREEEAILQRCSLASRR